MENANQNMDCPFCNNKNISVRIIYKDDLIMAFPTNIPITPGHTLICPVRHVSRIDHLLDKELIAVKNLMIKLKHSLKKSLAVDGFNIAWNEGVAVGQSVEHLHPQVVPRKVGDAGIYEYEPRKFLYRPGSRNESPVQELQEIAELLKKNLD
jgi:diadenosine tetraphosphate (Ap4A) HIT family hydrolase